ncbi:MAG: response regulator transcription factor [Oscillospiraceae bacterium]|nr:response regulator transcription factor [Oscillospiraceae bacterium]
MNAILIIEDDTHINELIATALEKQGYYCRQAFSGTEGLLYAKSEQFSLVIMDLMLPGMNGEQLLPELKKLLSAPVIVISAKDSLDSKIELLQAGADDYLTKPFELPELVARVGVQLRRTGESSAAAVHLSHKSLTLDTQQMSATLGDAELPFTKQEYKILELLMKNPTRVFSKQDIYDYAWEGVYIGEDKTINMHISNIRKKIKAISDEDYIDTVWGVGFRLAK